jgi:hypothetical protein
MTTGSPGVAESPAKARRWPDTKIEVKICVKTGTTDYGNGRIVSQVEGTHGGSLTYQEMFNTVISLVKQAVPHIEAQMECSRQEKVDAGNASEADRLVHPPAQVPF